MTNLVERLNGLWCAIDALGGTSRNEYESGYVQGVIQASIKLEEAGFSEGRSEAADEITRLQSALTVSQAEKEVMREALNEAWNFIGGISDKQLEDIHEAQRNGAYSGDRYDAPDDYEAMIAVTCGEVRAIYKLVQTVLQSTPPTAVARVIEAARDGWLLDCSRGAVLVFPGDLFKDGGAVWRVLGPTGDRMYSPSGLGGTPTLQCEVVWGKPIERYREFMKGDRMEYCGDSVAALIHRARTEALASLDGGRKG